MTEPVWLIEIAMPQADHEPPPEMVFEVVEYALRQAFPDFSGAISMRRAMDETRVTSLEIVNKIED